MALAVAKLNQTRMSDLVGPDSGYPVTSISYLVTIPDLFRLSDACQMLFSNALVYSVHDLVST